MPVLAFFWLLGVKESPRFFLAERFENDFGSSCLRYAVTEGPNLSSSPDFFRARTYLSVPTHADRGGVVSLRRKLWHRPFLVILGFLWVLPVSAGPVILGGDDLPDHGSRTPAGVNLQGWLYIQKALDNILNTPGNITRSGNDGSIAALGSSSVAGCPPACPTNNTGAAVRSAAAVLGKTINFHDGVAAINTFFANLASGTVNPAMIWLAGSDVDAANNLDVAEGAALTANASAIAGFVNSGGGLMSHGGDDGAVPIQAAYGWLAALIPGLVVNDGCNSLGAILTPAGQSAFPGLSNSDIDRTSGPCHNHFTGNLGSLSVLAQDGATPRRNFIIGGGAGTIIAPQVVNVPTLSGWMLVLLGILIAGSAIYLLSRRA